MAVLFLHMLFRRRRISAVAAFLLFYVVPIFAGGFDDEIVWRPVTPDELQQKAPKVEPDADAEAIFWEIRLDDRKQGKLVYSHYVRVKIFTERGRERFSKMDIPFIKGRKIEGVAARVIRPDGTVVLLKPEDIFEREIAKAGKAKVLAKSFAVPGIDNADAPVEVADSSKISRLQIGITIEMPSNILRLRRAFHFGANGKILFPVASYQPLKALFEKFQQADSHAVAVRQKDVP